MPSSTRPLRPGDIIRVDRSYPRRRVDEDVLDFLRVHYETDSPGLGHVVEVREDGMVISLWGHLFFTPVLATNPDIRPLGPVSRVLAPERLGEAILRREIAKGYVVMTAWRQPRQLLLRWWLRSTRGPLPILEALGGRIRPPPLRWAKARLQYWLGRWGVMPPLIGFLDHGMLVDRIGMEVELAYSGRDRRLWLDRVLLHKNHSIHLVGIDLDSQEQRTFRLDKVWGLSVPGLGEVDRDDLYWELQSLVMSRSGWLWYWNRHQERLGRPLAPPIGTVGKALSLMARPFVALWDSPHTVKRVIGTFRQAMDLVRLRYWRLRAEVRWHVQEFVAARRPLASRRTSRALAADAPWRRRLQQAISNVEAGRSDQVTCLLPMNALLDAPLVCRAYLRHLLELTLREAVVARNSHPEAAALLAEALAISPPSRQTIRLSERRRARALLLRLRAIQPGSKRIWVHATRRAGADASLLLGECYLSAIYRVSADEEPHYDIDPSIGPEPWWFYRTGAYFVARWENRRFRVDAAAVPRLRAILEWWNGAQ